MDSSAKEDNSAATHPVQCSALRKGGFAMLKGKPCKIVEMSTSKTGKHGHAKANLVGLDLFTSKKVEDTFPSSHRVEVPEVQRQELVMSSISHDGYASLLKDTGEMMDEPILITKICDKSVEEIQEMMQICENNEYEDEVVVTALTALGEMVIKDAKMRKVKA